MTSWMAPSRAAHQLVLSEGRGLVMQPAKGALPTIEGDAALGDIRHQPVLLEDGSVVRPGEESPLVLQPFRFDQESTGKVGLA